MSEYEEAVAKIWTEILDVSVNYSKDDFFELGGTSLLLMEFIWRAQDSYQVEIAIEDIFDGDITVEVAARAIERAVAAGTPIKE